MKYVGIQTQIRRNNMTSIALLVMFPVILLAMVWLFLFLLNVFGSSSYDSAGRTEMLVSGPDVDSVNSLFLYTAPWVVIAVGVWFLFAYFSNTSMIRQATNAHPLLRRDNPRVYNIVENLCITANMEMPQINIVADSDLNAFASGIDDKTYTITVTTGLLDRLNDRELAGVLGHELTHIRNRDTRMLITSIVFVGIVSTVMSLAVRMIYNTLLYGGNRSRNKGNGLSTIAILLIGLVCSAIAYFFTLVTRFAISRKREFMADAGSAELTNDPEALASALRKISDNPGLGNTGREDVAQLFIVHPQKLTGGLMYFINSMFATHPSTAERIRILEQF